MALVSNLLILLFIFVKLGSSEFPEIHHPEISFSEILVPFRNKKSFEVNCTSPTTDTRSNLLQWQKQLLESDKFSNDWVDMAQICRDFDKTAKEDKTKLKSSKCTVTHHLTSENSTLILSFEEPYKIDLGRYSCGGENVSLADSTIVTLRRVDVCFSEIDEKKKKETLNVERFKNGYCSHSFKWGTNSSTVYEGRNTTLLCHLIRDSERYKVIWKIEGNFMNETEIRLNYPEFNYTETSDLANLTIPEAKLSHQGRYYCALWDSRNQTIFDKDSIVASFDFVLRVHRNYRWLSPFYVILVQVLLLASGLFVYEKSQAKRNSIVENEIDSEDSNAEDEIVAGSIGDDTEHLPLR